MTRGFSLLEVLIALTIIATTLVTITLLTIGMPDLVANTRTHRDALLLASSGILREMARGANGFSIIESYDADNYGDLIPALSTAISGDGSTKLIKSSVSWQTRWGVPQSIVVNAIITDYKNASDYACSPLLHGDWALPKKNELTGTFPPFAALTTTRTSIIAVASTTADLTDPSVFIFRSVPDAIERTASFDSSTSTKIGYVAVAVSGSYVYALSAHSCPQENFCATLDTLSLTDDSLTRIHSIPLPPARSIFYQDGRLYVGLRTTALDAEFLIFDVSSPEKPVRIGSSEIGDSVNDISVIGTRVYVGTSDNSANGNKALMAFDIENPYEGMQAIDRSRQSGAGISQRLARSGNLLLLGRSSPLNSKELYIFDVPNIKQARSALDVDSSITGIVIRGFQVFVLTRTRLNRLQITDPANPKILDSFTLPSDMSAVGLSCSGTRLYVIANDSNGGHLITLSGL